MLVDFQPKSLFELVSDVSCGISFNFPSGKDSTRISLISFQVLSCSLCHYKSKTTMASRVCDQEQLARTWATGQSLKDWDDAVFSQVMTTTLPPTNFLSTSNGFVQQQYMFNGLTAMSQRVNWGKARLRAPTAIVYSSSASTPMTTTTAWGFRGSSAQLVQSAMLRDKNSGTVFNYQNQECFLAGTLDNYIHGNEHLGEQSTLFYNPPGGPGYNGSDIFSSQSGTDLLPFSANPYSQTNLSTLVQNPSYNPAAQTSALTTRQVSTFSSTAMNASQSPLGVVTPGFVLNSFDIDTIADLHPAARDLDMISSGWNWDLNISLNNIYGQVTTGQAMWHNLGSGVNLCIAFPQGISIAYEPIMLDLASERLFQSHMKSHVKHVPYLNPVIVVASVNDSRTGPLNYFIGNFIKPAGVIHLPLPTGALTNSQSASPLLTNTRWTAYSYTVNNIPVYSTSQDSIERQYNEFESWVGSDAIPGSIAKFLKKPVSYSDYQSFATYLTQDLRPFVKSYGESNVALSVSGTRTDSNGPVDHIFIVYCLRQYDYVVKDGLVSVKEVA